MLKRLAFAIALTLSASGVALATVPPTLSGTVAYIAYANTNVPSSSYTTIWQSTPQDGNGVVVCDTSGVGARLALGPAGQEVDFLPTPATSGTMCLYIPQIKIPAGSRVSIRTWVGTNSSGIFQMALLH